MITPKTFDVDVILLFNMHSVVKYPVMSFLANFFLIQFAIYDHALHFVIMSL